MLSSLIGRLQVKCYRILLDLLQIVLNIAKLKDALHLIWTYCNSAAKTSLKRLQTCISTNGGQFEQLVDQTESRYDKNIAALQLTIK